MKTIVVGLGNPILGDDGAGWRAAEQIQKQIGPGLPVDVACLSLGGMSLMEHLIGYERAILIDTLVSEAAPGTVQVVPLEAVPDYSAFHVASAHDTSLQNALKLGRSLGANLPDEVIVVGIATSHVYDFSEQLSGPVAEAIPQVVEQVLELVQQKVTVY